MLGARRQEGFLRIRLAHSHRILHDGQILTARHFDQPSGRCNNASLLADLDLVEVQPYIFTFDKQPDGNGLQMLAFEFQIGTDAGLESLDHGCLEDIAVYVVANNLQRHLALEIVTSGTAKSDVKMTEFEFEDCTLALDSRGVPERDKDHHIATAWSVNVDEEGRVTSSAVETYYYPPGATVHQTHTSNSNDNWDRIRVLEQSGIYDMGLLDKRRML